MAESKVASINMKLDATEVVEQIKTILTLFELPPTAFEGIPQKSVDLFFNDVRSLIDSIGFCDFSTAISTTDTNEVCLKVKIVGHLEHLATAIGTGNLQSLIFKHS